MSKQIEINSLDTALVMKSEPVLLAVKVEKARIGMLSLLLENPRIAEFIAGKLIAVLRNGSDSSDMILVKNCDSYKVLLQAFVASFPEETILCAPVINQALSHESGLNYQDYPVQRDDIVQDTSPGLIRTPEIPDTVIKLMNRLHFLPVFLIDAAVACERNAELADSLSQSYKTKLRRRRMALKSLRQQMVSANTGLVAFVAHKYRTHSLSFEDLMQEGLVGLIKAVDRFDPDRGLCFSTYAIYWIRQAISRLIVKQDKIVPLPVAIAEKASSVFDAMRNCYLRQERWPTVAELKDCCDLSEQELKLISSYYQATHTLDMSADDDGLDAMEKMHQSQFAQPLDDLIDTDLARYVDKAVSSLPEKQATILAMRFGLKNHTEMTLQAVADQLHVTRERVRQIQNEALQKLKQQFGFELMLFLEPNDV